MDEIIRIYKSDEIAVKWRPALCVHCGNCTAGLPEVFILNNRPWVDISAAPVDEIKRQVGECPSGALSLI